VSWVFKEFSANPKNVSTRRKRGNHSAVFKRVRQIEKYPVSSGEELGNIKIKIL
jgi:hypothetical protein